MNTTLADSTPMLVNDIIKLSEFFSSSTNFYFAAGTIAKFLRRWYGINYIPDPSFLI